VRRATVFAAVCAALLAAAPAAQARRAVAQGSFTVFEVAGDAVAWSDLSRPGGRLRVRVGGAPSRLVFSQRVPRGYVGALDSLAASERRLGIIVSEQRGDDESPNFRLVRELWTGPLSGPLTRALRGVVTGACQSAPSGVAVGEDALISVESTCPSGANVVVRDFATSGTARTIGSAAYVDQLGAAGRFVAWRHSTPAPTSFPAPGEIVVFDVTANAEAYRIASDPSRAIESVDVQADGKVLVEGRRVTPGTGASQGDFLDWYSVAEPTPHPLSVRSAFTPPLLGADRVLLSRIANRTTDELLLSDLNSTLTTVARFPRRTLRVDVAFDGRTAAYVETNCIDTTLFSQDVSTLGTVPHTISTTCPVRITGGLLIVRSGRAKVKITCPRGCAGTATLTSGGRRIAPVRQVRLTATGSVTVTLDARARRALARTGSVPATVTVRNTDRNSRARRTSARVVLDP
jgi:hypothetical protein